MIIDLKTGERIDSREGQTDDREERAHADNRRTEERMLSAMKELEEQAALAF